MDISSMVVLRKCCGGVLVDSRAQVAFVGMVKNVGRAQDTEGVMGLETIDLVNRNEVLLLLEELKRHVAGERRQFLIDGRAIEAGACGIQMVAIDSAMTVVKAAKRRG